MKNEFSNGGKNTAGLKHSFANENPNENESNAFASDGIYAHYAPSVRLLRIRKTVTGACGFHLTRTKWDPYPWVSAVDAHTAAEMSGLQAGDCVLEVNGEDVLGLRITDIAKLVQAKSGHVTLLLWSCGSDFRCDPESICCAPMPRTLQRLATIVQSILTIIECPVCLDTITPPALQCQNGHLLCLNCRIRAERCPVCRDRYTPQCALIAEQIYAAITSAYNLCSGNEDKLRQKLYGPAANCGAKVPTRRWRRAEAAKQTIDDCDAQTEVRKASMYAKRGWLRATKASCAPAGCEHVAPGDGQPGHFSFTNETDTASKVDALADTAAAATETCATKRASKRKKILMKLWHARATSMENLSTSAAATSGQPNGQVVGVSSIYNGLTTTSVGATTPAALTQIHGELSAARPHQPLQSVSNRFVRNASSDVDAVMKNSQNLSTLSDNNGDGDGFGGTCEAVDATAAEMEPPTLLACTQQQTETRSMTMPLNCATTKKTILNVTTRTTNKLEQVNVVSTVFTATPTPTATPTTNDFTPACKNDQPKGEEAAENEEEVVKERINGKISETQRHVQPHLQLSTWEPQPQHQNQRQQLSTANSTTDSQPTDSPAPHEIAVERCPSMRRSQPPSPSIFNDCKNNEQHQNCNCPSSTLLYVDKRRPARRTLSASTEYLNKFCQPAATDAVLRTSADTVPYLAGCVAASRKNSNSDDSSGSSDNSSDITASAHAILTPASSLSSGVFSTSVDPNDLAASIEARRAPPDDATEITAITAHENALLSPADSLGQSSSITSSLRSLSSLASSLFSSVASDDAPLPSMATACGEACPSSAVLNSSLISSAEIAIARSVTHSPSLCQHSDEAVSPTYRCACDG